MAILGGADLVNMATCLLYSFNKHIIKRSLQCIMQTHFFFKVVL